tara:strand:+ start:22 stop:249 length:228 start_codon:yes stop_codon:yes gene_type:complete
MKKILIVLSIAMTFMSCTKVAVEEDCLDVISEARADDGNGVIRYFLYFDNGSRSEVNQETWYNFRNGEFSVICPN